MVSISEGGTVHFGRTTADNGAQFVSRPTGVSFYVKYNSVEIDNDGGGDLSKGEMDEGQIKVAIGKWENKYGGSSECADCASAVHAALRRSSGGNGMGNGGGSPGGWSDGILCPLSGIYR